MHLGFCARAARCQNAQRVCKHLRTVVVIGGIVLCPRVAQLEARLPELRIVKCSVMPATAAWCTTAA